MYSSCTAVTVCRNRGLQPYSVPAQSNLISPSTVGLCVNGSKSNKIKKSKKNSHTKSSVLNLSHFLAIFTWLLWRGQCAGLQSGQQPSVGCPQSRISLAILLVKMDTLLNDYCRLFSIVVLPKIQNIFAELDTDVTFYAPPVAATIFIPAASAATVAIGAFSGDEYGTYLHWRKRDPRHDHRSLVTSTIKKDWMNVRMTVFAWTPSLAAVAVSDNNLPP